MSTGFECGGGGYGNMRVAYDGCVTYALKKESLPSHSLLHSTDSVRHLTLQGFHSPLSPLLYRRPHDWSLEAGTGGTSS